MKSVVSGLLVFFISLAGVRAQSEGVRQKAIVLKRMIERNHYSPRPIDDSFSVSLFKAFLNQTDPRRLIFTDGEYKQLLAYSSRLDDELKGTGWAFFDLLINLYKNSLNRADTIIQQVLQNPFDFSVSENIMSSREKQFTFSKDRAELVKKWSRYLKFMVLNNVYSVVSSDSSKKMSFKEGLTVKETAVRQKVKQDELKRLKKILHYPAGISALVSEMYLNAIATCFDPHTNYFSPEGKESFQSALSTQGFSFGMDLDENEEGQIVIDRLTPGGPAWRSGELHKGDQLLSLQWEGKQATNVTGVSLEEVYEVLEESVRDRLVVTVKKNDGTSNTVFLRKEKIENEENIVRGFVLKGEKKIGYILLPGFYSEWENEMGSSCANDVAKEIVKLKKENIDGLIIDVRFNGGGSLREAIEMIGIFIEEGPLATQRVDGKQVTLKDPNRGTIYDGPLALLVNGQSASASEILAASLQDYNRALIIGSTTHGKSTMQQLFLLDTVTTRPYLGGGNIDMMKITRGKLYRLNGLSAQLHGVVPDIPLPDAFAGLELSEKFLPYALSTDTIKANNFYKPLQKLPTAQLAAASEARVKTNNSFRDIMRITSLQKSSWQTGMRFIPLKWDDFENWIKQVKQDMETMDGEGIPTKKFTIENHTQDKQFLLSNDYAREVNNSWLRNLMEDIYIEESFLVIIDLIKLQKATTQN